MKIGFPEFPLDCSVVWPLYIFLSSPTSFPQTMGANPMRSVVIANSSEPECEMLRKVLSDDFDVFVVTSPEKLSGLNESADLIVLDHNFTDQSGIDVLSKILGKSYIPILMVTAPDEPHCAVEAIRRGAYNYLVKTTGYHDLLSFSIKEAIDKFNEREEMKGTILALKKRVTELENQIEGIEVEEEEEAIEEQRAGLIEAITSRFKRGEINLPSYPKINSQFRYLVEQGATILQITDLLKQDVGISSKLLSISNSPYYSSLTQNKTLEQAVSRLGLKTTKNYVEIISNRSLYATNNKKYKDSMKKLWEHSLSCGYASEILSGLLHMKSPDEVFTMGLLHDIGKLLLMQVAIELETSGAYEEGIDRTELIDTLNSYHGTFGGSLLKKWKFPNDYSLVARCHHTPGEVENVSKEFMVVHLANLTVKSMGYSFNDSEVPDLGHALSLKFLNLDLPDLDTVKARVTALMRNSAAI